MVRCIFSPSQVLGLVLLSSDMLRAAFAELVSVPHSAELEYHTISDLLYRCILEEIG
jgi:hypothetical protein